MSRRTAAALLITRGAGRDCEVFLAERSPELRFFGGYWALPGGTLDDLDGDPEDPRTLEICARRELFEETGLCWPALPASTEALASLRREMLERDRRSGTSPPAGWHDVARTVEAPRLTEVCRIETPPFAPVRYDTIFYHVPLEECAAGSGAAEPDVWPGELIRGRFFRPSEALATWRRDEMRVVPPVVILLEHLEAAADLDTFRAAIGRTTDEYRNGRLHRVRFAPGIVLAPLRTPTLPPATTTNCYLVGSDPLFVIDPGSPNEDEQHRLSDLLDELECEGIRPGGILVTHHHPDHIGGVVALSRARDLPVHGHAATLERLPDGFRKGRPLSEGELLPLGPAPDGSADWHLRVLHTPGHDRGHLCFAESRYRTMIVGDMLSTISTIIVDPPEGHLATYLDSLGRLEGEPITTLFPAHGPPMRDGQRLVRQYIRHRRHREASLRAALAEASSQGGATLDDLLPKVYWDADPQLYRFASRSLLAGLEKLLDEGLAARNGDRWRSTDD